MSHARHHVYVHLIWATRLRAPLLHESVRERAWACIWSGAESAGAQVMAVGGVADHVHMLVRLPPSVALASVVKRAKGATSHLLNQIDADHSFAWQEGYAAFSVDLAGVVPVSAYIAGQAAHHAANTARSDWEDADV